MGDSKWREYLARLRDDFRDASKEFIEYRCYLNDFERGPNTSHKETLRLALTRSALRESDPDYVDREVVAKRRLKTLCIETEKVLATAGIVIEGGPHSTHSGRLLHWALPNVRPEPGISDVEIVENPFFILYRAIDEILILGSPDAVSLKPSKKRNRQGQKLTPRERIRKQRIDFSRTRRARGLTWQRIYDENRNKNPNDKTASADNLRHAVDRDPAKRNDIADA